MSANSVNELNEFYVFLGDKLKNGGADLSPEEALDEWRELHPEPEFDDATEAIQEALDDMDAGDRGRPAEEVIAELRDAIKKL